MLLDSGSDDTPLSSHGTGPFKDTNWGRKYYIGARSDWWSTTIDLVFDASRAVPVADDNRPYNIKLMPILIY